MLAPVNPFPRPVPARHADQTTRKLHYLLGVPPKAKTNRATPESQPAHPMTSTGHRV
jgi:hypothetical protein